MMPWYLNHKECSMGSSVILWIQQFSSPAADVFVQGVTMLGEEYVFMFALTFVYWCIDKAYGAQLSYTFFFSMFFNSTLKVAIGAPRPIGVEGIRTLREHTATGFAFPSGHTQATATFWYYLMISLKKPWITFLGILIITLMGLSRMYLGVHWPADVIGGIAGGILFVHIGRAVYSASYGKQQYLLPVLFGIALIPAVFFVQDKDFTTLASIVAGASAGFMIEQKYICYTIPESWKFRLLNCFIGLSMFLVLREGGKLVIPEGIWSYLIRYSLIGFWAAAGAPWIFTLIAKKRLTLE